VPHRVTIYAHRGASLELPENTLVAFERALELGADALESDIHMTRDGHIVMSHDSNGRRCAGVPLAIRRCTLDEVRRWDAGWGKVAADGSRPFAGKGHRIATLDEALDAFPETPFNLDVKQARPSMVGPLLELLGDHAAEDRVTLASFHLRSMLAIRRRGFPHTSLTKAEVIAMLKLPESVYGALPWRGCAAQLPLSAGRHQFDTLQMIDRCHRLGLRIDYWTVNDAAAAIRLCELGADGIMTDNPAVIAPAVQAWRARQQPTAREQSPRPASVRP